MTFTWTNIDLEFAGKCKTLLSNLKAQGVVMVPYFGLRSLEDQSKLWRTGRPQDEILQKIAELKAQGCDYLATHIQSVGPQPGDAKVTDAIPGLSWHNWGKAMDIYATINNNPLAPNWDGSALEYKLLAQEAVKLGLTSGFNFPDPDHDHVQLDAFEVPSKFTLKEVNDHFDNILF